MEQSKQINPTRTIQFNADANTQQTSVKYSNHVRLFWTIPTTDIIECFLYGPEFMRFLTNLPRLWIHHESNWHSRIFQI